ncbi:SDR family NAD(P)-dependent oxidoreductase [Paractinoplanes toevensis]|uniref:Dehydrogenase n=1 Tax=Paractinoplanes toevensis TaxID=571911 RepID=A0A919W692_9ACTN|nr:SDR family NAD(P)-dependent oxidoreductase [Actinoplanes toevensis]GIM92613.1 dehydrogenase [Actinoplanes toevensis]
MTDSRISLITGANKGIGFAAARLIGGTVLVGARDKGRGEAAVASLRDAGTDAHLVVLDVTDGASVAAAAAWIDNSFGRLDVLVNNAAAPVREWRTPPSAMTAELLREVYETNVIGPVAVINAMLPLLRRSAAGRIVNVSSRLGSVLLISDPATSLGRVNLLAYNSSKSALNSITVAYAKELRDTAIKVNSVNPGFCETDMAAEMPARDHVKLLTAEEGAAPVVAAALLPDDGPTGMFLGSDGLVPW